MTELIGDLVEVVGTDGAARPARTVALWNPTLLDPDTGERASALAEAAALIAELVARDLRVICFGRSRRMVEVVHRIGARDDRGPRTAPARRDRARTGPATPPSSGASSSGGWPAASCGPSSPRTRSSSASTSACSTARSRSASPARSRACASSGDAPAAAARASRCWWPRPTRSTSTSSATRRCSPAGPSRRRSSTTPARRSADLHLRVRRLRGADHRGRRRDPRRRRVRRPRLRLAEHGDLRVTPAGVVVGAAASSRPATSRCARRRATIVAIVDTDTGQVLGTVEQARAPVGPSHEGAVYLHLGESWHVSDLDLDERVARVQPFAEQWYTQAQTRDDDRDRRAARRRAQALGVDLAVRRASTVTEQVLAYQRRGAAAARGDRHPRARPAARARSRRRRSGSACRTRCSTISTTRSARCTPPSTR